MHGCHCYWNGTASEVRSVSWNRSWCCRLWTGKGLIYGDSPILAAVLACTHPNPIEVGLMQLCYNSSCYYHDIIVASILLEEAHSPQQLYLFLNLKKKSKMPIFWSSMSWVLTVSSDFLTGLIGQNATRIWKSAAKHHEIKSKLHVNATKNLWNSDQVPHKENLDKITPVSIGSEFNEDTSLPPPIYAISRF